MLEALSPYAKAIIGGVTSALIAFLTALAVALNEDGISAQEWLYAVVALLVALGGTGAVTYQVKNKRVNGGIA